MAATAGHFAVPERTPVLTHEVVQVAAIDESPSTIGIADSNIYFTDSLDDVIEHLDLMESLGVKNVRLLVPWIFVQPTDPMGGPVDWDLDLNWAKLDQIVAEADRRGMGILGVLQWTPDWATEGPTGNGHPTDVQDFADFAAAVAQRYRDEITAYEVWNEPNASFFWNPIDPIEYTNLLKATYSSLKAVNPDITVVGAVVSATLTWGDTTMNAVDFVEAMYAAGADGFFDALSFHPYNFDTKFSEQDDVDWRELMPLYQVEQIRALMDQHQQPGEEQLKIWISEYGLPTSVVSPEKQLAFITDLLTAWQSFSGGGPIFMYTTKDDMAAIGDERFFGLFDEDGNFKGSEQAFKDFVRLIDCLDGCSPTNPSNPLASLVQLVSQLVSQVLSFVPNLIATVVAGVVDFLGNVLGGLSSALGGATSPMVAGASLRAAAFDERSTDAVAAADPAMPGVDGGVVGDGEQPAEVPAEIVAEAPVQVPADEVVEVVDEVPADEVVEVDEVVDEVVEVIEVEVIEPVVEEPVQVPAEDVLDQEPVTEDETDEPAVDPVTPEPASPEDEAPEGSDTEGSDTEGTDTEGSDTEGTDTEGSDTEGTDTEGTDTEGSDTEGSDTEGTDTEGTDTEGTDTEGTDTEAAEDSTDEAPAAKPSPKRAPTGVSKSGPRTADRPAARPRVGAAG